MIPDADLISHAVQQQGRVAFERARLGPGVAVPGGVFYPVNSSAGADQRLADVRAQRARVVAAKRARLTSRQGVVLTLIESTLSAIGVAPTMREICQHLGTSSTNGAVDHLRSMERKGVLHAIPKISRGIVLCTEDCPVCRKRP